MAESLELLGYRSGANPSRPHHFYFFLIFLINASRSLLSGARGTAIIHVFGFDQADIAQNQSPETNRQTPSRGNFHIAAADQYPRL